MVEILKHCCLQCKALSAPSVPPETKAMVSASDTDTVKRWLTAALMAGSGGSSAALTLKKKSLAGACQVSVQAVDGWLRTGRITKSNLETAAAYLQVAPSFTRAGVEAREHTAAARTVVWPFHLVPHAEVAALPKRRRDRLDKLMRERLDDWSEDDAAGKRRAHG